MGRACRDGECYRCFAKNSARNKNKIQKPKDSAAFTGLNGFVTSGNTNETYSAISEISSSEVAGPSYDIRETADTDVAEFENIREKNRHLIGGFFFMHFCPGTMTSHAESTAWTGQTFTTHTTLNTEQNQLAIKESAN